MLLYISSNKNIGIFDFIMNEQGLIIKKLTGEFNIGRFVLHDMRNLTHCTYVAIDMSAVKDTPDEFKEAIRSFHALYESRLIIYKEDATERDALIGSLIEQGVYNIITGNTVEELKEQILTCVSKNGMSYEDAIAIRNGGTKSKPAVRFTFPQSDVRIAVAGTTDRVGTTTVAINLCQYLNSIGASVSYTEANGSGHLKTFSNYYGFETLGEERYRYKNIEYFGQSMCADGLNFNVVDFGLLQASNLPMISMFQVRVLCADMMPHERERTGAALSKLSGRQTNILVLEQENEEQEKIELTYKGEHRKIRFREYSSGLFDKKTNSTLYFDMLKDYITER